MNREPQEKIRRPPESTENVTPRRSLLGRLLARRRTRRLERRRQTEEQLFAWHVQKIIAGCGLTQADWSIGGGRSVSFPQVVSVVAGPPMVLDIRILPGQTPNDYATHAPAIAYNLGAAEVRVIPLEPSLIRLELLPEPGELGIGDRYASPRPWPAAPAD